MTAIKTNQAELIGWLNENPCPVIDVHCHPNDLEARAKWLKDFAFKCDELVYAVAGDSSLHADAIIPSMCISLFADALHDSSIAAELESEAYDLTESLREQALENA